MHTHAHIDLEIPAPSAALWAHLSREGGWLFSPDAGENCWLGRTWQVRPDHGSAVLRWLAETPGDPAWRCYTTLELIPAASSTHVRVHVALEQPAALLPALGQLLARRKLTRAVHAALASLRLPPRGFPAPPRPDPAAGLGASHPLVAAAFQAMGAQADLDRIRQLDQRRAAFEGGARPALQHTLTSDLPAASAEYDLVYAGGGLGLIHAALMARRGYRVLLFDRHPVGCAHREWNISQDELGRLVASGLVTWEELEREIIMARYADGVVRFYAGGSSVRPAELHLPGVLDIALDAGALLRLARARFEEAGGTIWEGWDFRHVYASPHRPGRSVVALGNSREQVLVGARLLIDGMGATSPLTLATQPFNGICPTVGTVVRGVTGHDPALGDILVSVADTQGDRQLIWEGFPGRDGELTVYVFYYDRVGAAAQQRHSLLDLFEDYFALLPSYKQPGPEFAHIRPVYGYIPARHALRRPTPLAGVLPVGDSSAQQSPLTFCGFGSFVRNLGRGADLLEYALRHNLLAPEDLRLISAHQANVSLNWVLSRFMSPWGRPQDVNELQNVFGRVMNEVGYPVARRFFQDQMTWSDYRAIIMGTLHSYPAIIPTTLRVLGWRDCLRWLLDWLRFSRTALAATLLRPILPGLIQRAGRHHPRLALRWRAAWAEWQAMGWVPGNSTGPGR